MNSSRLIRFLRRRYVRRTGLALAILATLAALFYAEENWRGARAWARVKADLEARGEPLKWEDFVESVPAEQNFWAAPVIRERIVGSTPGSLPFRSTASLNDALAAAWEDESKFDLPASLRWLRANAAWPLPPETGNTAADILAALAPAEPELAAMREAVDRSRAEPLSDHLDTDKMGRSARFMMETARLHILRIYAFLAAGRTREACDELVSAIRLSRKLCARPVSFMHLLVGVAVARHPVGMVRDTEGRMPWNAQELENLETELSALNVINPFAVVLRSERAYLLTWLDRLPGNTVEIVGRGMVEAPVVTRLFPSNWKQLWKARWTEAIQQRIDGIAKHGLRVEADRHLETAWLPPQPFVIGDPDAPTVSIMRNCLGTQAEIEIARIAIAAGRHRIAHGHLPASLEELRPLFPAGIPDDPITGAPLEYKLAADDSFTVTSRGRDAASPDDDIQWRIAPVAKDDVAK